MSKRTWVCLTCEKSYRHESEREEMNCPICGGKCVYVDWKIRIPSPKRKKQWKAFWEQYQTEKLLLEEFNNNPQITEINLKILNYHVSRD